jgi:hypothetical protein
MPEIGDCLLRTAGAVDKEDTAAGYPFHALAVHLLVLVVSCVIAFRCNRVELFAEYDGNDQWALIKLEHTWLPAGLSWCATPFQALFNSFIYKNYHLSPCFKLAMLLGNGKVSHMLAYTLLALEIFLAMVLLCRLLRIPAGAGFGAAWLMTLFSLPFWSQRLIHAISQGVPLTFEIVMLWCLAMTLVWHIGRHGRARSLACSVLTFVMIVWAIGLQPSWVILAVPVFGLFWAATLIPASRSERLWRVLAMAAIALALAPTALPYVVGNYLYSVPTFFTPELENHRACDWYYVSIICHGTVGTWVMAWGGLLGAVLALIGGTPMIRAVAGFLLASVLGITCVGFGLVFGVNYIGPPPLYFEFFLWPFYAIFSSMFMAATLQFALSRLDRFRMVVFIRRYALASLVLPIACLMWLPVGMRCLPVPMRFHEPTPLVETLRERIGLQPGTQFRGAVATFTGYQESPEGISWSELMYNQDFDCMARSGNDHRGIGLWYYEIPTLFEYNQFMTPSYYAALSRLLSRPCDKQVRNYIVLTKPNYAYLGSLGIRFVIADFIVPGSVNDSIQNTQSIPRLVQTLPLGTDKHLYLYELDNCNFGDYSPTQVRVFPTAGETLAELGREDFDFHSEVLTVEDVPETLARARHVELTVHKGYIHVKATSPGTSLLLLPVQFSHCLRLEPLESSGGHVRLLRANLMQTGLVFSGTFEGRLRFSYGPFNNPYGRLRDYFDMKELKLGELNSKN